MKQESRTFFGLNVRSGKTALWIFGSVLAVWSLYWLAMVKVGHLGNWETRGQFGDMFGALNTMFSGLALAGIIYTILLQREELEAQRQELSLTRREFSQQNETLRLQRFENTFFSLLQSHVELLKLMDLRTSQGVITAQGRDCFRRFYERLDSALATPPRRQSIELTLREYLKMYKRYQGDLSHYFRNVYHIVRLIDESGDITDKMRYIRLLRAQLSSYELVILFYNCLTPNGVEKFKPLIEKYRLFKNIDFLLLFSARHKDCYEVSAYGIAVDKEYELVSEQTSS